MSWKPQVPEWWKEQRQIDRLELLEPRNDLRLLIMVIMIVVIFLIDWRLSG
jgi:hypothetical protein